MCMRYICLCLSLPSSMRCISIHIGVLGNWSTYRNRICVYTASWLLLLCICSISLIDTLCVPCSNLFVHGADGDDDDDDDDGVDDDDDGASPHPYSKEEAGTFS